ncbi:MAG: glycosyltransferase family 4 protein [Zoogloeaceae bacterium]|jgi:glycosyltransferase involved in cell wall biosynthesis|nr:glycosyltransferase family 4 protein [Zoogloeaceae bacterium]
MRIVIDVQGAQSESRFRGIGRYTLAFAKAVARNRGRHEILLAASNRFPETIDAIRAAFRGILPQENIRVWDTPPHAAEICVDEDARNAAELLREAFLLDLRPDVLHVCSLFEGYCDDAATSIGRIKDGPPVSVTLHDLIPLLNPEHFLDPDPRYARFYRRKLIYLHNAALLLANSDSTREEGLACLKFAPERIFNVSAAAEAYFRPQDIDPGTACALLQKFGIERPFVLYTGGADQHKNLSRLIRAYAALPAELRAAHQILFAGRMPAERVRALRKEAEAAGLTAATFLFSGYVTDAELVDLYNLCRLFVFPSWHEGFGLPALEAMACGAPVIAANAGSLPEVVGWQEALFDPFRTEDITARMQRALQDETFCAALRAQGREHAAAFSWDTTARRAIAAWEAAFARPRFATPEETLAKASPASRLIRALAHAVPQASDTALACIARDLARNRQMATERQLFLDLSELCQRDAATGVQRVVRGYLKGLLAAPPTGWRVTPVYAEQGCPYRHARRFLRRFLDLPEHAQTAADDEDDCMRWQRGDLFFGLDLQHHVQLAKADFYRQLCAEGVIVKFLVHDLLPLQFPELFRDPELAGLHRDWLAMVAVSDGAICVSRTTAEALVEWLRAERIPVSPYFRCDWTHSGADIALSAVPSPPAEETAATLAALQGHPSFLCVATIEPRKEQAQILDALEALWASGEEVNMVFVGQPGWKMEAWAQRTTTHPEFGKRLFWLQSLGDADLERLYGACTALIAASRNEGFGLPLVEAARRHLPVIARDIPVFREVAQEGAFYFTGASGAALAEALRAWLALHRANIHPCPEGIAWRTWREATRALAALLTQSEMPRRQLLTDISELAQQDAGTGIQRVVRNLLAEWRQHPPGGFRIEAVYATPGQGYRYARRYLAAGDASANDASARAADDPIDYAPGDVFLGLDLQPGVVAAHAAFYQHLRRHGVRVYFVVYDLLCLQMPQYFVPGTAAGFARWLKVVAENDGAFCISQAVADTLAAWLRQNDAWPDHPFIIESFPLGAGIDRAENSSDPVKAPLPADKGIDFLMVGTLEPRKGHAAVLDAFETCWAAGMEINLRIVGKQGWLADGLAQRLRAHTLRNRRLFWFENADDRELAALYANSACLIAASYGEGFGLPLIEAARQHLPILARDIPVFREVAGDHAFYFSADGPPLVAALQTWLTLRQQGRQPPSTPISHPAWQESAAALASAITRAAQEERESENGKQKTDAPAEERSSGEAPSAKLHQDQSPSAGP